MQNRVYIVVIVGIKSARKCCLNKYETLKALKLHIETDKTNDLYFIHITLLSLVK